MAKKVISDEVIYDSDADAGMSTDSDAERELEQSAVEFVPPRKYSKKTDTVKPTALEEVTRKQQVWLIKLPADVDVGAITSLPLDAAAEMDIDGKKYSITEEIPTSKEKKNSGFAKFNVLVPGGGKFRRHDVNITKFLDVTEKVEIPQINYGSVVVARENVEREENLRMRHFPTGYYIGDFAEAQEPVVPGPSGKKRSREVEVGEEKGEKEKKKHKKEKKDKKEKRDKKDKKEKHKSKKDKSS